MSNMSYCRFENTCNDLQDCLYAMQEADSVEEMDLNKYEMAAIQRMRDQCQDFLDRYAEMGGK